MKTKFKAALLACLTLCLAIAAFAFAGCVGNDGYDGSYKVTVQYADGSAVTGVRIQLCVLNEDGEEVESDKSIVTRNAFTTDGMTVVFDADAKVTYKLYFYDEDEKLLSATDDLAEDFSGTIPEKAVWAKAVITPTEDEDGKVSLTEVFGYASALTITVNR